MDTIIVTTHEELSAFISSAVSAAVAEAVGKRQVTERPAQGCGNVTINDAETGRQFVQATLIGQKDVLTTKECAMLTGFTEQTLREYARRRTIPHYKRGGRILFDKRQVEDWLRTNPVKTLADIEGEAELHILRNRREKV